MNELQSKQVSMHKDFFDRCTSAIDSGFYIEAVLMEYAAIESRLESICGMLTLPCGQHCAHRKDVKISTRIECLRYFYLHNSAVTENTNLAEHFFSNNGVLRNWIRQRDVLVHALYKNAVEYNGRIKENEHLAKEGYTLSKLLYKEAKRINRLRKNHPELFENISPVCKNERCAGCKERN